MKDLRFEELHDFLTVRELGQLEGGAEMDKIYTVKTALKEYFQGTLGETKLRELIRTGEIPHARAGTRILIRKQALDTWMAAQESQYTEAKSSRLPKRLRAVR